MLCHSRLGVWVLLAAAAAVELYDERLPTEMGNDVYQDINVIDTGPLRRLHLAGTETTRLKDLLLFKLIQAHLKKLWASEHRMSKDLIPMSRGSDDVSPPVKRFAQPGNPPRPAQQRWKIKKGRVIGSQMVCYFKLCAFRNPA